ncbi:MAG: Ig-like domain-containing protein, partial [Planctomycetes bacterium]|nr:Ig-like domain-containing protein [Planctomycetota bacterium]
GTLVTTGPAVTTILPVTLRPGPADRVRMINISPVTIAVGSNVAVTAQVEDANGNLISGASITLAATGPGTPANQTLIATPTATFQIEGQAPGTVQLAATTAALPGQPATAEVIVFGVPNQIVWDHPDPANPGQPLAVKAGGEAVTLCVVVTDINGNPVVGAPIRFVIVAAPTDPGTLTPVSGGVSDSTGRACVSFAPGTKVGGLRLSASHPATSAVERDLLVIVPAAPVRLALSPIPADNAQLSAGAATPLAIAVTALDAFGNAVPGVSATLRLLPGFPTGVTLAGGTGPVPITTEASVNLTAGEHVGIAALRVSAIGLPSEDTQVTIIAGAAATLTLHPDENSLFNTFAEGKTGLTIVVVDQFNNLVPNAQIALRPPTFGIAIPIVGADVTNALGQARGFYSVGSGVTAPDGTTVVVEAFLPNTTPEISGSASIFLASHRLSLVLTDGRLASSGLAQALFADLEVLTASGPVPVVGADVSLLTSLGMVGATPVQTDVTGRAITALHTPLIAGTHGLTADVITPPGIRAHAELLYTIISSGGATLFYDFPNFGVKLQQPDPNAVPEAALAIQNNNLALISPIFNIVPEGTPLPSQTGDPPTLVLTYTNNPLEEGEYVIRRFNEALGVWEAITTAADNDTTANQIMAELTRFSLYAVLRERIDHTPPTITPPADL